MPNETGKKIILGILLLLVLSLLIIMPLPALNNIGRGDFIGYWSAAYLLRHSQNFSDPALLLNIERTLAGWQGDFTILTWNPPWLLTILLPYTLFSFPRATWLWLMTNLTLISAGSILTWLACTKRSEAERVAWLAPLIAMFFLPVLTTLFMGQINTLVFFGLGLFLFLQQKRHPLGAGGALALTMVKPHLVYITVPILLIQALLEQNWRFLAGFAGVLLALTAVALGLRPSFPADYAASVGNGNLLAWITPTLGGILDLTFGWQWAKLMGLILLPLAILLWWQYRDKVNTLELVQLSLLVSIITAPFGWAYDVVVLLIPLLQVVVWLWEKRFSPKQTGTLILALLLTNSLIIWQRFNQTGAGDEQFFWVPLALSLIYFAAFTWKRHNLKVILA